MAHLLPIKDPEFSVREVCKQLVLLEEHLAHPNKRCPDCIRKHFLTAEAHAEEALGLGAAGETASLALAASQALRQINTFVAEGGDPFQAAQAVRKVRKALVLHCYEGNGTMTTRTGLTARTNGCGCGPARRNPLFGDSVGAGHGAAFALGIAALVVVAMVYNDKRAA